MQCSLVNENDNYCFAHKDHEKRSEDPRSAPVRVTLATALHAINGLLSEKECAVYSLKAFQACKDMSNKRKRLPYGLTRAESLLTELMYLRVETRALRLKNRRLKHQLSSAFLPQPKIQHIHAPVVMDSMRNAKSMGVNLDLPPLAESPRLPPLKGSPIKISGTKLPPLKKVLLDIGVSK